MLTFKKVHPKIGNPLIFNELPLSKLKRSNGWLIYEIWI